jgi:hypothetical protein
MAPNFGAIFVFISQKMEFASLFFHLFKWGNRIALMYWFAWE